ncbi:topoisomerase TRF4 [Diaporthe amygdali]|uniref:topoisomerase TRF4 n=1 Tax=Phomopsis amygdali TaxID=1214568 RepID=UPI0022FE62CE|nr:topoisomerase TRF4 [Diaporthe amygdali]KAJ0109802.1 topoisomerase TRF4 [Diaporthe amygdali]
MSHYYPPPPGVDRRSNASRSYPPPPPGNDGYGGGDSYRPPPPPSYNALPPPPSGYDSYPPPNHRSDHGSRYSRNDRSDRDDRNDRYQPSRRSDNHPLPPRPQDPYPTFRGSDSFRPPQGDFNFRSEKPRGVADTYTSYRPDEPRSRADPPRGPARGPHNDRQSYRPNGNRGRGAGGYAGRRPWRPFVAAERAILQSTDNNKPREDFADTQNGVTYRTFDQLSDSDEADMDISDDENESAQPSAKRARTAANSTADEAPKWSNPDPYTALPPEQDPDKKKKDVVQLIRKARVEPAKSTRTSLPADDEDFIRCESGSEDEQDEEEFIDPLTYNRERSSARGIPGTTAPRPAASLPAVSIATSGPSKAASAAPTANKAIKRVDFEMDLPKSTDLGSRKRTHDDVLKLPAHAQLKAAPKRPSGGSIVSEWRLKKGENNSPWVTVPDSTAQVNVRLHMEISDFYDLVRPREFEDRLRGNLVDDLNRILEKNSAWRGRKLHAFGSFMSGLYLPTGDMDLVLCSDAVLSGGNTMPVGLNQLKKFRDYLRSSRVAVHNNFEMISKARVPLVKYVDSNTGLKVDISFENPSGVIAIQTFRAWREQYPVMPILVTVIKQFLLMRGLNEPVNGGIGGFSVICMVVSMLQMMPQVQSGDMVPERNLGSLLMHFFDLYGNRFNYKITALRLNPPGYNQVTTFTYRNPGRLSIIDPNNPANDISGGSQNYPQIMACFAEAHKLLQERIERIARGEKSDSILEIILGGNYSMFREQRNYLRKVHRKVFGYCDE